MNALIRSIALGSLLLPVAPVGAVTTTTTAPPPSTTTTSAPRASTTTTSTLPASTDTDHDGVPDSRDKCPGTPAGEKVDKDGCSVAQLCPCAAPRAASAWKSHGDYLHCLKKTLTAFVKAKTLDKKTAARAAALGARSRCGGTIKSLPGKTQCCAAVASVSAKPFCLELPKKACAKQQGKDIGAGSCAPNACH